MSSLAQRFTVWQNELKRTEDRAKKCSSEILAEISRQRDDGVRSKVACKMIKIISEMLSRENAFYDVYVGLFRDLVEFVSEDQWDFYIQCLNYSIAFLVNKGQHNMANLLIPIIEIRPTESEKVISTYFSLYSNALSYLIVTDKYDGEVSTFFKGVILTLKTALHFDQDIFIRYAKELLQTNKNFQMCLKKHIKNAQDFFDGYSALHRKISEVDNFDDFYVGVTSVLVVLFKLETEAKRSVKICSPFIKALMAAECLQTRKHSHHILGLYYYLLKLYDYMGTDKFNENMQLILDKFLTVFNSGNKTEVWFMDSLLTLSEIFYYFAYDAKGYVDEKNIVTVFDLLIKMTKLIPEVNNIKTFCNFCTSVRKHEICHIARAAMHFFEKAVEKNIKEESVYKYALSILSYALLLYKDFKCEAINPVMINVCNSCLRSISAVEDKSQARYAVKMLQTIIDAKITPEMIDPLRSAYFFKKFYCLLGSYKQCLEAYCFYIVYLLETKGYEKESIKGELSQCNKMYEVAGCDFSLSICDILDNKTLPLEVPKYDRKRLIMFQLEVACRILPNENFKKNFAENIYKNHLKTELEFALFVHLIGNIALPKLLERVEISIQKLKESLKKSTTEIANNSLALGFLHKRLFLFQYEKIKKVFPEKAFTDTILSKMDRSQFKMMDIATENSLVKIMSDGIEYFRKYFENRQSCTLYSDHAEVIDCISYLARHLKLRGYVDHAFKGWKLVYDIACDKNDTLNKIRSLSFFCEHSYLLDTLDKSINLKELTEINSTEIFEAFEKIDTYSPRRQNYILLCILNIGRFYVYEKEPEVANKFSQAVELKLNEIESRKGRFEFVTASLCALNFLIAAKGGDDRFSPYTYVYFIMDNIKKIESLTSEDSVNLPSFLFDVILEITQFTINRFYSVKGLKSLLYMLLSYGTEYALTLRTAQTICTLAHVDLHAEMDDASLIKFDVIKSLMNNKDVKLEIKMSKAPATPNKVRSAALLPLFDNSIEPVRKAVTVLNTSPISEVSVPNSLKYLNQFLTTHSKSCSCELCKSPVFHMIYFQICVLHARMHYIRKNLDIPEMFYEEAYVWWNMLDNGYLKMLFRDAAFWMLMYYVNTLRKVKNYDKGLEMCNVGLEYFNKYEKVLDVAHYYNMFEQKYAIEYIKNMTAKGVDVISKTAPVVDFLPKVNATPRYTPLSIINLSDNTKQVSRSPGTKTETGTKVKLRTEIKKLLAPASPILPRRRIRKPYAGSSSSMPTIKVYASESRSKNTTKRNDLADDAVQSKSLQKKPTGRSRTKTDSALEEEQKQKNEDAKPTRLRRNRL